MGGEEKREAQPVPRDTELALSIICPHLLPCPSTLSRCRTHEGWFLTQKNTAAVWRLSGPRVKGGNKLKRCEKKDSCLLATCTDSFYSISDVDSGLTCCTPESQGGGTGMYRWTGRHPGGESVCVLTWEDTFSHTFFLSGGRIPLWTKSKRTRCKENK